MVTIVICPLTGTIALSRLMWTCALSIEPQWRIYTLNWCITKPSFSRFLRKVVASYRSFFVVTGKSNITKSHIT